MDARLEDALRSLVEQLEWIANLRESDLSEADVENVAKELLTSVHAALASDA